MEPDDIAGREFPIRRRGYDRDEVRAFLRTVAQHVEAELATRRAELSRHIELQQVELAALRAEHDRLVAEQHRAADRLVVAARLLDEAAIRAERRRRPSTRPLQWSDEPPDP